MLLLLLLHHECILIGKLLISSLFTFFWLVFEIHHHVLDTVGVLWYESLMCWLLSELHRPLAIGHHYVVIVGVYIF